MARLRVQEPPDAPGFRPRYEGQSCSLGYLVADWIEAHTCHGPGDLQGETVVLDTEWLRFLVGAYTLDPATGRRLYDEAVLSRPKGRAKSELAGLVGIAEAFGPVRFDGWDAEGQPVGRPVVSPLLKCLATEEGQAGNTFENVAWVCGEWGKDNHPDLYGNVTGARQYQSATALYLPQGGEIRACSAGAASKDGGKETWVCADETHLYNQPELRSMYATVRRNLGKRKIAEPWLMQTTTMYRIGEQSVAEDTFAAWRKGDLGTHVLVDHREASGKIDLDDEAHTIAQLEEVYGEAAAWHDLGRKYRDMRDPRVCKDDAEACRYFLNRAMQGKDQWCDPSPLRTTGEVPAEGEAVALGFDGSQTDDDTALWGCRLSDGHWFRIGHWSPRGKDPIDALEVDGTVSRAFEHWNVALMFGDPWGDWRPYMDLWALRYGSRVREFDTRHQVKMARALDLVRSSIAAGHATHDGDEALPLQLGNAVVRRRGDLVLIGKDRQGSPRKIDVAMAATLARAARDQAVAEGLDAPKRTYAVASF